jgi:hypothetical protein
VAIKNGELSQQEHMQLMESPSHTAREHWEPNSGGFFGALHGQFVEELRTPKLSMISQKYQKPMFLNILRDLNKQLLMSQALLRRANLCSVPRGAGPLAWAHETIDYRDSDIYAVTEVYGSFLKWGIPTSPWVSLLNQSNGLDDLGYTPHLRKHPYRTKRGNVHRI